MVYQRPSPVSTTRILQITCIVVMAVVTQERGFPHSEFSELGGSSRPHKTDTGLSCVGVFVNLNVFCILM